MPSLSFAAPTSVDEAVKILAGASGVAKVLAGGTDLLVQLRAGPVRAGGIVEGMDLIGSEQIQGRASFAGNLCNASPAADSVPALIAARATAAIAGPNGRREAPVEAIVTGPGQTSLAKGEFLVEFYVPKPKPHQSDAYLRFIPRTEMDIAVVGCGVNVTLDQQGACTDARVVLGAVAPTPLVVDEAAQALIGHRLDDETLAKLDAAAGRAC